MPDICSLCGEEHPDISCEFAEGPEDATEEEFCEHCGGPADECEVVEGPDYSCDDIEGVFEYGRSATCTRAIEEAKDREVEKLFRFYNS